jgi:hypothetical protein
VVGFLLSKYILEKLSEERRGHEFVDDYDCGLSLLAAESNAFRIQADLASLERFIAALTV